MNETKQSALDSELRDIWTDAYKFHATFDGMGNTPEEWKHCAYAMVQLTAKHHNHPLADALFLATYDYLSKARRQAAVAEAMAGAGAGG